VRRAVSGVRPGRDGARAARLAATDAGRPEPRRTCWVVSYDARVAGYADGIVSAYLASASPAEVDVGALAYYASLDRVAQTSPRVAAAIVRELDSQRSNVKLIASENYSSLATQLAHGNLLIDKYAEGYPGHRFYPGCENIDEIESEAVGLARELFGAEHAYVQPHSGADANLVAFLAILGATVEAPMLAELGAASPVKVPDEEWAKIRAALNGQRLLAMDFFSGGHLSHGYRFHFSSRLFDVSLYTVDRATKLLDLDALRRQAREVKPRILLGGYSAYTRRINFAEMRDIADEVGAVLMVDMAHFAGLVAGKVFTGDFDPVAHAHVVTSTTHKTLRGPRGGIVLCKEEYAEAVDKGCPTVLGGPLSQVIAAKAVSFREALQPDFRSYAASIVENASTLAEELQRRDVAVLTGGTENHIVLADVASSFGLTGMQAETALRSCGLTLNRNALPFDEIGPWYTSGLRMGSAAITTLGFDREEIAELADIMRYVLGETRPAAPTAADSSAKRTKGEYEVDPQVIAGARARVRDLLARHPVYPEIDLGLIASTPLGHEAFGEGGPASAQRQPDTVPA
jgi:glycine hydroxymethyltransferase